MTITGPDEQGRTTINLNPETSWGDGCSVVMCGLVDLEYDPDGKLFQIVLMKEAMNFSTTFEEQPKQASLI